MMEWTEYVSHLLSSGKDIDNLTISFDEGHTRIKIPPIIKASITILDKLIEQQEQLNVIVFPERSQSIFIYTLMNLFHNILMGNIQSNYDPTGFTPGDKLKVGNAVVEYLGHEKKDGMLFLNIKSADINKFSAPIACLPIFQRVSTNRRLSKWDKYVKERKLAMLAYDEESTGEQKLSYVTDMKTHLSNSIYTMTSIASAKELLSKCNIDGKKVTSIFYIAQADYEGKITNISPGQMAGNPAIVFASDMYAISSAAEEKQPIQSIIIDGSNTNELMKQLDALDNLIKLKIPIVCITDVANSFELDIFSNRGFNIWRWDNESLTNQLYNDVSLSIDKKTRNCAYHSVRYLKTDCDYICDAMKFLSRHRWETKNQSPQMMRLFERLNNLAFSALRSTIPFSELEIRIARQTLTECLDILNAETDYLDEASIMDYRDTIAELQRIYIEGYSLKKNEMLKDYLLQNSTEKIILVIPEKAVKAQIQNYWNTWCLQHGIKRCITVLLPSEYYNWPPGDTDTTIICSWLKRAIMRKVIYSFNTRNYVVLLYEYENRWKNHDSHHWIKALSNKDNKAIIEKSFCSDRILFSTVQFDEPIIPEEPETIDELGEIELILRENKYRQYVNGNSHFGSELVNSIPINFVGGYLAFYRTGHKIISATKIITSDGEKIETKLPTELRVGDFIVVRETDKDLVREIADIALANSGKEHFRSIASKWREAVQIELLFCSVDDFCEKVKIAGCDKGITTIKRWIEEDDIIAPQSKDDLRILATVTKNETLLEMLDSIFDAAKEVRNAHIFAGRKLSDYLKLTLAKELKKFEDIDPFNFWEPIEMEIDGIGSIKVLKIIDVGAEIHIDTAYTNRLIEE